MGTLLMFPPKVHFDDANGAPLAGGKVYTYKANEVTLIPKDTYTDKARSATHTNPIILDSRGEAEVWLDGEYKFIIKDANDVEIYTVDDASTETVTGADSDTEWYSPGLEPTFISATSFSVEDDQTAIFHEGRRVRCAVTAGTVYGVVETVVYSTLTTVTIVLDSGNLDAGLTVADVGILSAQNQSYPIQQIQYGGYAYVADTGVADAYVAVMVPPVPSYVAGFTCKVLMVNANLTTTPTINVNGLGAKTIKRQTGTALVANDIVANQIADLFYDGTDFILMNLSVIEVHAHIDDASGGLLPYPLYSDGEDGAYSSGATGNIPGGLRNNTTFSIGAGHVMTVNTGEGIIIIADTSITIAGEINADSLGGGGGNGGVDQGNGSGGGGGISASGGGGGSAISTETGGKGGIAIHKTVSTAGGAGGSNSDGGVGVTSPETNMVTVDERYGAGGGGGGGSSSGTNDGGDGGVGGGFIILIAPIVTIEATAVLSVVAGNGSNGEGTNTGGGGGGGGGGIFIISHSYTDNGGTFNLAGGSGGVGESGAADGGVGGTGLKRVTEL